ncbi:MAG: hypothetical protein P8099_11175 [Gemmatimonadota bacterium]|jgi:hypothetical protein
MTELRATSRRRRLWLAGIIAVTVVGALTATLAMRRSSTTFDEIFMVGSGVHGLSSGDWDMTLDHPPIMQYLYGVAAHLAGVKLPEDNLASMPQADRALPWRTNRFIYAQELYFRIGNDPERIAFYTRLVGILFLLGLAAAVAVFTWRAVGPPAALLATVFTVFLPDVLAHAGIAYNDLPIALAFFLGAWAWDVAIRRPTIKHAVLAAVLSGLALGVKFSALALGVVAAVLFVVEGVDRVRRDRDARAWLLKIAVLLPLALVVTYLTVVLIYRGDFTLSRFWWGISQNVNHAEMGHGVPITLLGQRSVHGFWYFFPVAIVLKTPAAFHALALLAAIGFWMTRPKAQAKQRTDAPAGGPHDTPAGQSLRPIVVGALVFLGFLLAARLDIGTRHALPLMPLIAVLVAAGAARLFAAGPPLARWAVGVLTVAFVASTLAYYPWFLSYLTEYVPHRKEMGYNVMVDSNLDWGQGLLALRDWMHKHDVDRVYLSYFGSALPSGYGIHYAPLPSFFPLRPPPAPEPGSPQPEWAVVSATNMSGAYLQNDAFRFLQDARPDYVLADCMYVYHVANTPPRSENDQAPATGSESDAGTTSGPRSDTAASDSGG